MAIETSKNENPIGRYTHVETGRSTEVYTVPKADAFVRMGFVHNDELVAAAKPVPKEATVAKPSSEVTKAKAADSKTNEK